ATTRPVASMSRFALSSTSPTATMRPSRMPMSARRRGAPVPSTTLPPMMRQSSMATRLVRANRRHLEDMEERRQRDVALEAQAGPGEERLELGPGALAARPGEHEHEQVEGPGQLVLLATVGVEQVLDDEQAGAWGHRLAHVGEDGDAPLVVPVVDDGLQDVEVAAVGDRREEVARDQLAAIADPARREGLAGIGVERVQLEQDPVRRRVSPQHLGEEDAAATSHVAHPAGGAEVVAVDDERRHDRAELRERPVERGTR